MTYQIKIRGTIEKTIFRSRETGFSIAVFQPDNREGTIRVLGNNLPPPLGDNLELTGKWDKDEKYGWQFRVFGVRIVEPASLDTLRHYLSSAVRGVGQTLAQKIIKKFGLGTGHVLRNDIERLKEIEDLSPKTIEKIRKDLKI